MEEARWTSWRPEPTPICNHPFQDKAGRFREPLLVEYPLWVYSFRELHRKAKEGLESYFPMSPVDDTVQVLSAFWRHLPGRGKVVLMAEIAYLCSEPDSVQRLRQLRHFLVDAIINPMTAANVQNGPVFYENGHACRDKTVPQEKKHDWTWRTMALKKKTLARDGNRCVLTGMADMRWYYNMDRRDRKGLSPGETQCAYILPFALSFADTLTTTEDMETTWAALYRYFPYLQTRIGWHTICTPANTITLSVAAYEEFVAFDAELEPDKTVKHKYHYHPYTPPLPQGLSLKGTHWPIPETIVMENHSTESPMPNGYFLLTHCRLARILRDTGLGYKTPATTWKATAGTALVVAPAGPT